MQGMAIWVVKIPRRSRLNRFILDTNQHTQYIQKIIKKYKRKMLSSIIFENEKNVSKIHSGGSLSEKLTLSLKFFWLFLSIHKIQFFFVYVDF